MPATAATLDRAARAYREPITLRLVDGLKPPVEFVYAYDRFRKTVFVRIGPDGGQPARPMCVHLLDLEAFAADGRYVPDVEQVVRAMVEETEIFA